MIRIQNQADQREWQHRSPKQNEEFYWHAEKQRQRQDQMKQEIREQIKEKMREKQRTNMDSHTINKKTREQLKAQNELYFNMNKHSVEHEGNLKKSIDFSNNHIGRLPRIKDADKNNSIKIYLKRKFDECKSEENLLKVRQKDRELAVFEYNKFMKKRKEVTGKVGSLYNIVPERNNNMFSFKNNSFSFSPDLPPQQIQNIKKAQKLKKINDASFHNLMK